MREREQLDISLARFENIRRTGTLTPLSVLAKRFGRDEAVISRVIGSAFRSGLVEVRVIQDEGLASPRRTDLEREILKKYPALMSAIVISVTDPPESRATSSEEMLRYSDYVHRFLGTALAREISHGPFIRSGDHVGIGPGRGVYETVRAMQKQAPVRARDVTLVSLSGVGYMRHHAKNRNLLLDPDFIVAVMGEAFEYPVALDLVAAPLVPGPEHSTPFRNWLSSADRARPTLDMALLGVGVFTPGNRFYEEASTVTARQQPAYDPIRAALQSLRTLSAKFSSEDYIPLGDLGYHIFLIPPPTDRKMESQMRSELERQVDAINKYLLSAHRDHFQAIRSAVLIAGTAPKARALNHLLAGDLLRIAHVCIDKPVAEALLQL